MPSFRFGCSDEDDNNDKEPPLTALLADEAEEAAGVAGEGDLRTPLSLVDFGFKAISSLEVLIICPNGHPSWW